MRANEQNKSIYQQRLSCHNAFIAANLQDRGAVFGGDLPAKFFGIAFAAAFFAEASTAGSTSCGTSFGFLATGSLAPSRGDICQVSGSGHNGSA